jgi:hypothetical protein
VNDALFCLFCRRVSAIVQEMLRCGAAWFAWFDGVVKVLRLCCLFIMARTPFDSIVQGNEQVQHFWLAANLIAFRSILDQLTTCSSSLCP